MISSRQLEYFQAVARELHFTRAAEALRIAQPALSQQIRKLERQLGLDLFERNNHKVALTPAGAALLAHTERILSDLVAVEEEMLGWAGGVRGHIRLGVARGLTARLARVFAAFSATYPSVEIELQEQNTVEMLAGLHAGRLDVVTLAAPPPPGDRSLVPHPLGAEPLVLVTGETTALAERRSIAVGELDGVDLIKYPPGSAVGDIIAGALATAEAQPRVRFETRDYTTARALVNVGLAAAIMPSSVAWAPGPAVRVVELVPAPVWTPALAWSANRRPAPALATLIDFMVGHPDLALDGDTSKV